MASSKERMVHTTLSIEDDKLKRLKAIAAARRIPMAVLVREGLDRVLELAEKQQATTDRYLAAQGTDEECSQ